MDGLWWKTLLKWMIWGYHYFWKHPTVYSFPFFKFFRCRGTVSAQFVNCGNPWDFFHRWIWWTHVSTWVLSVVCKENQGRIHGLSDLRLGTFDGSRMTQRWRITVFKHIYHCLNCLPYLRDQTFDSTTWMVGYYASNCIPNVAFITCNMQPWSDWRIRFHFGCCNVFLSTEVKEANFTRWQKFGV